MSKALLKAPDFKALVSFAKNFTEIKENLPELLAPLPLAVITLSKYSVDQDNLTLDTLYIDQSGVPEKSA